MRRFILIAVLCLLNSASADEFSDIKAHAEQGVAWAQNYLGTMYNNGDGVPQDFAEAMKWYRKSADQGNAKAQNNIGFMYHNGQGVLRDYGEAAKWYRKAADQGFAMAQFNLGFMYFKGQIGSQDYAEAYVWFSLAASSGQTIAVEYRDMLDKELTKKTLKAARKRAAKLYEEIQQRKQ